MSQYDIYRDRKYSATAQVEVTISVAISGGGWGGDCTVAQVHKQAADQARGKIHGLAKEGIRIVGEPRVTAVLCPPAPESV